MAPTHEMDLEEFLRQQESLREVIESISAELELRPLLTRITRHACELLGADNGTIGLVDEEREVIRTEAAYRMPPDELGAEAAPGVGLFGQVFLTQQPLILDRYGDLERPPHQHLLDYAVIGMPIFWRDRMIGVFGLGSPPPRRFSDHDVEVLSLFAKHAAIAIENARLFAAERQRTAELARSNALIAALSQVAARIETAPDPDGVMKTLGSELQHLGVACIVALLEPDTRKLLLRYVSLRRSALMVAEQLTGLRVGTFRLSPERWPLYADLIEHKRALFLPDAVALAAAMLPGIPGPILERIARLAKVTAATRAIYLPLMVEDRVLGILGMWGDDVREADLPAVSIFASQVAIAIDNARRYEEEKQRTERLGLIARVSQRIAARLDPDELFATTVEELHGRLDYDHVSLFLLDPVDPRWLVQHARASRWPRGEAVGYRQRIEQGVMGVAARQRVPKLVNDVTTDPNFIPVPRADELRAELAVPILLGERLLGILDVGSVHRLREEDVTGIQTIADQLAIAIDNARLFADTQRVLDETQLLYETARRISTALDVDDVVGAYLEQVAARGRYACSIALYQFDTAGGRTGVIVRGRWTPDGGLVQGGERHPYTRDALDPLLDAGETVTIADVHTDLRVSDELRQIQARSGRPALALIPLIVREQRIGLVVLSYPTVHHWRDVDLKPYQATAAQLATAIDSRRQQLLLYERGQQLAVVEERRRLARELHDSVTQLIFSITLIAQSIGSAWRREPAEGERRINRLLELSQAALAEMRALLVELRPPDHLPGALATGGMGVGTEAGSPAASPLLHPPIPTLLQVQRDGLPAALRAHIANVAHDGLTIDFNSEGYSRLRLEQEEALYRIAQEALNNIVKHAGARHVQIILVQRGGGARLVVRDDGIGFDPDVAPPVADPRAVSNGGMGLRIMRERAEALGGSLHVATAPGRGTIVELTLPEKEGERP